MDDPLLSRDEKCAILRRWEHEARGMDVAEEENMGGGSSSVLSSILRALNQLGEQGDRGLDAPTKHGGL
jgi:hypothetical protein